MREPVPAALSIARRALVLICICLLAGVPGLAAAAATSGCSVFRGARVLSVGGRDTGAPVIPVAIDEVVIDLGAQRACHRLRWSIYTVKRISREQVCFDIGTAAKNVIVDISATFPTGITAWVTRLSAQADRATAIELAQSCRLRAATPRNGRTPRGGIEL